MLDERCDKGGYLAARLLSFKKGFDRLDDVGSIEYKTLREKILSFDGLSFEIHCKGKDLEINVTPLNKEDWSSLSDYLHFMKHPDFYKESGFFDSNFLKGCRDFLGDLSLDYSDSPRHCKVKANLLTNNSRKAAESIFYAVVVPFTKYRFNSRENL